MPNGKGRGGKRGGGGRRPVRSRNQKTKGTSVDFPVAGSSTRKDSHSLSVCGFVPDTPCSPPVLKLQPGQIRMVDNEDAPCSSTMPSEELSKMLVDGTTGLLKNPSVSTMPGPSDSRELLNESVASSEPMDDDEALLKLLENLPANSGSEMTDDDEELDLGQTDHLAPADVTDYLHKDVRQWLRNDDIQSDRVLRELLPTHLLRFDWSCNYNKFKGHKETFRGTYGPTFPVTDDTKPIDIFLKIFDDEFLDLLVTRINRCATRQMSRHRSNRPKFHYFKNTDKAEMAVFLAILILHGCVPIPAEKEYWADNGFFERFNDLMPYNRFALLNRRLQFTDSTDTTDSQRLRKLQPVLDIFNKKFSTLYLPGQDICIDESLVKKKLGFNRRIVGANWPSLAQNILSKAAKTGIRTYELWESATGYLWSFFIYAGRTDEQTDRQSDEPTDGMTSPTGATSKIVNALVEPLFDRGHSLAMDNLYNSPLLARYLKTNGTDCYGTLRVDREFVPEAIKSSTRSGMRHGELVQSFTHDVSVTLWDDGINLLSCISTYHNGALGGKEQYRYGEFKPQVILDYNHSLVGVQLKDELMSSFTSEEKRHEVWYKKIFRTLFNCALVNCFVIYKSHSPDTTHWTFRNQLAQEIIKYFKPPQVERNLVVTTQNLTSDTNQIRPVLRENHFNALAASSALCRWCKKKRTKYICDQCDISLCVLPCFMEYHT